MRWRGSIPRHFAAARGNRWPGRACGFNFHLAPPLLAKDPRTGHLRKLAFGPWMMTAFRLLASSKAARHAVRSSASAERRNERGLIGEYEALLDEILVRAQHATTTARRRDRRDPGEDPRLRPRQGAPSRGREGRRGGAARSVPLGPGAAAEPPNTGGSGENHVPLALPPEHAVSKLVESGAGDAGRWFDFAASALPASTVSEAAMANSAHGRSPTPSSATMVNDALRREAVHVPNRRGAKVPCSENGTWCLRRATNNGGAARSRASRPTICVRPSFAS